MPRSTSNLSNQSLHAAPSRSHSACCPLRPLLNTKNHHTITMALARFIIRRRFRPRPSLARSFASADRPPFRSLHTTRPDSFCNHPSFRPHITLHADFATKSWPVSLLPVRRPSPDQTSPFPLPPTSSCPPPLLRDSPPCASSKKSPVPSLLRRLHSFLEHSQVSPSASCPWFLCLPPQTQSNFTTSRSLSPFNLASRLQTQSSLSTRLSGLSSFSLHFPLCHHKRHLILPSLLLHLHFLSWAPPCHLILPPLLLLLRVARIRSLRNLTPILFLHMPPRDLRFLWFRLQLCESLFRHLQDLRPFPEVARSFLK